MKKFNHLLVLTLAAGIFFFSCDGQEGSLVDSRIEDNPLPEPPTVTGSQGTADFTKFVSIGNSLTAGFMDGALYNQGQQNSLGALIAAQLKIAVESDGDTFDSFDQPDINSSDGYLTSQPQGSSPVLGRFKLDLDAQIPSPTITGEAIGAFSGSVSALNNFGVPGIQVGQLLTPATGTPGDPAFNPFYARMASSPGTSTIIGDAVAAQPTFFTLWIGNNDVLGYALSGASNEAIFTSAGDFDTRFSAAVDALLASPNSPNGIIANIPPILTVPYFRAVPYNALPLDQASADQLNAAYANYNGGLQLAVQGMAITQEEADRRTIQFSAGANGFVMVDEDLTDLSALGLPNYRQTEATDLIPLPTATALSSGIGTQTPADDQYVLTPEEQNIIQTRTVEFNTSIATKVAIVNAGDTTRLGLFDTNAGLPGNPNITIGVFADLLGLDGELGIRVEGTLLDPDFAPNGVYSTDGIHPNIRGNAIMANEFIDVIEATFGANIPAVSVIPLPGIAACAGDCVSQQ